MHPTVRPHSFGLFSRLSLLHLQIASLFMVTVSLSSPLKEVTCTSAWWKLELTRLKKVEWGLMDSSKPRRRTFIKTGKIILVFYLVVASNVSDGKYPPSLGHHPSQKSEIKK